jgi:hypothetical protein
MRSAYVHTATLQLGAGTDPAAVGAAVTVELCGHWDHEGDCRWPHNNEISVVGTDALFRTVFVAPSSEASEVHERIDNALRTSVDWSVQASGPRPLEPDEEGLLGKLVSSQAAGLAPGGAGTRSTWSRRASAPS